MVTWCVYTAVPNVDPDDQGQTFYQCAECGHPRWSPYLPEQLHRMCGSPKAAREQIERDITPDITPQTRTMEDIRKTLDKCFGGCRHMRGICTRWGTCGYERKQAWYEYLLENDCNDNNHV